MTINQHLAQGHSLERIRRAVEDEALRMCGGNVVDAAKLLGVSRGRFYDRLKLPYKDVNTIENFANPFPGMSLGSLSESMREERKLELSRLNAENALMTWRMANSKPLNASPITPLAPTQLDEVRA